MFIRFDDTHSMDVEPTMKDYQDFIYKEAYEILDDKEFKEFKENKEFFYKVIKFLIDWDFIRDTDLTNCDDDFKEYMKEKILEW